MFHCFLCCIYICMMTSRRQWWTDAERDHNSAWKANRLFRVAPSSSGWSSWIHGWAHSDPFYITWSRYLFLVTRHHGKGGIEIECRSMLLLVRSHISWYQKKNGCCVVLTLARRQSRLHVQLSRGVKGQNFQRQGSALYVLWALQRQPEGKGILSVK